MSMTPLAADQQVAALTASPAARQRLVGLTEVLCVVLAARTAAASRYTLNHAPKSSPKGFEIVAESPKKTSKETSKGVIITLHTQENEEI
jgi:hypothetical protein